MKKLLITIAAVLLVGCGASQQSATSPEAKPIERIEGAIAPEISIHDAALLGHIEAVKQHLAAGTDVNAVGGLRKGTPLHSAAGEGYGEGHKEIVQLLIANGADVNAKADDGCTPLHDAAWSGYKEIVELLITAGADVNAGDKNGATPLDLAAIGNQVKNTETADLLRKHGGKTGSGDLTNFVQETPRSDAGR